MIPAVDPTFEQKQSAVDAVLHSKEFLRAAALAKLLKYLCEKSLQGRIHEIKEFTIATDVYGKDLHFGEKRDSLVRVEVSRLRRRLQRYYETEGAASPIRIVIKPGTYRPEFEWVGGEETESQPAPSVPIDTPLPSNAAGKPWLVYIVLTVLAGAVLWVAVARLRVPEALVTPQGSAAALPADLSGRAVRILAGSTIEKTVDRFGVEWLGDRYFIGGDNTRRFGDQERNVAHPIIRHAPDQTPFRAFRYGHFSYKIPLGPGRHELRLYFSEVVLRQTDSGDGVENLRVFDVLMNDKPLLPFFDIAAGARGVDTADIRVFENVTRADDGFLHLEFRPIREAAWLNAIEVIPNPTGRAIPIRIVARNANLTDQQGNLWSIDKYFSGGRQTSDGVMVSGTPDPELYAWQRYGHFSYQFPVPAGKYRVRLMFAETFFGPNNRGKGGAGSRVFNVYSGGTALLRHFDIFKEGGENRAVEKVFHGISPNPQGRIELQFEPVIQYPMVQAIEILPEDPPL